MNSIITLCSEFLESLRDRRRMAWVSQFLGIGMVWVGLPDYTLSFSIIGFIITCVVVCFTYFPRQYKKPFGISNPVVVVDKDTQKSETDNYIRMLAVVDISALFVLMLLTDGIKSPYSGLLLTIPTVTCLLYLPFKYHQIWVFSFIGFVLVGSILPIVSHFSDSVLLYLGVGNIKISEWKFFVISFICAIVIFLHALNDHYERIKP